MKAHIATVASLISLVLLLVTAVYFIHHGMSEGTLMGVIIQGAVGIAQAIAGLKPNTISQQSSIPNQPAPEAQKEVNNQ